MLRLAHQQEQVLEGLRLQGSLTFTGIDFRAESLSFRGQAFREVELKEQVACGREGRRILP